MNNQIFGIVTILICITWFWWVFKAFKKGKINISILFIVLCGMLLRFYVGSDLFLHDWDERYHALVSKNLIKHTLLPTLYNNPVLPYDFKNWTGNHIWVHKQPLPLWSMALSMKIFGVNEIALRMPSILLSTLAIFFTYYIGSYLFNKKIGLLASFFHSINGLIIEITGGRVATDHIDIFFLFFVELAVFLTIIYLQRKKRFINLFIGISIGLAILSKWLPALIVFPIWLLLVIEKDNPKNIVINLSLMVIACSIIFIPWQIYIHHHFPAEVEWESNFNFRHITETLDGHSGSILYHFNKAKNIFGELIYIPMIWFLYTLLKSKFNSKLFAIGIWFLIPYLFFSFVKTKMQGYILFAAPSIFIILSYFWWHLKDNLKNVKYPKLAIVILTLLILLPIRYSFERIKPFSKRDRNPEWAIKLRRLDNQIKSENAVIFNIERPIEAMFYSSQIAYPYLPTNEQIDFLNGNGYKIFIYNSGEPDLVKTD